MTQKAGGGRPWGPIRAENPAARKLAEMLRRHVDDSGKTLAMLSSEISMSKAQTGVYLAGKVPTQAFIVALVKATVRPELRDRRQEEALALREQALRPTPRAAPDAPAAAGAASVAGYAAELEASHIRQIETYGRLTRALEQRAEVERAKSNSDKLVMVLLTVIHRLDRRVAGLVQERDQLRTRPPGEALEDAERKLARAEEQERWARAELRRAEEKQRQAEDLEALLKDDLRQVTDELDRLRAGDTTSPLETLPVLADESQEDHLAADPVGDDIDAALARASAVNDEDNTTLNRVTSELNGPTERVVQDNPPDSLPHPESLDARFDHAVSLRETGDPKRSAALLHELLDHYTRTQGPDHPNTLNARRHHAVSVRESGDPERAIALFDELIPHYTRTQGPDRLETLTARHDHAVCVKQAGDPERSAALLHELLDHYTRTQGPDHPNTLNARHDHALSVLEAGDPKRSTALFDELIPHHTRALGPDHPETLGVRQGHAAGVREAGDPKRSAALLHELLDHYTRTQGPDHPNTLNARHNHAVSLEEAGDPERAIALFNELIPDYTRVLGPDHRYTLATRYSHAVSVREAGDRKRAIALIDELLDHYTRTLGPDHPDTLGVRTYRRKTLWSLRTLSEALRNPRRSL